MQWDAIHPSLEPIQVLAQSPDTQGAQGQGPGHSLNPASLTTSETKASVGTTLFSSLAKKIGDSISIVPFFFFLLFFAVFFYISSFFFFLSHMHSYTHNPIVQSYICNICGIHYRGILDLCVEAGKGTLRAATNKSTQLQCLQLSFSC